MATKKIVVEESTSKKEKMLQTIIAQLQTALPVLKDQFGEKKFEKRIKKAARVLTAGIKNEPAKKAAPSSKKAVPAKKAAPAKKKTAKAAASK